MTDALITSTDSSVVIEVAEFVLNHGVTIDAVRCLPTDVESQGGSDGFTTPPVKKIPPSEEAGRDGLFLTSLRCCL